MTPQQIDQAAQALAAGRSGQPIAGIPEMARPQSEADSYLIRCLVKLNRADEAVKEAEALLAKKRGQPTLVVLAHAARGGAKEALDAAQRWAGRRYVLEDCYRHPDLGPMLQSEPFLAFRERFPEPKMPFRDLDFDRD